MGTKKTITEHCVVKLIAETRGFKAGTIGTVIHIYLDCDVAEVEFRTAHSSKIIRLKFDQIKRIK